MNLSSAVALVPAKQDQVQVAEMDMLSVLSAVGATLSIKNATEDREQHVKNRDTVSKAKYVVDLILKGTEKSEASKRKAKEAEDLGSSMVRSVLTETVLPLLAKAIGRAAVFTLKLVSSVAMYAVETCVSVLGGAISFLVANPLVAVGLGILAVGWVGYKYFTSKDYKESEAVAPRPTPVAPATQAVPVGSEPALPVPVKSEQVATPAPAVQTATPLAPTEAPKVATSTPAKAPVAQTSKVEPPKAKNKGAPSTKAKPKPEITTDVANALQIASTKVGVPLNLLTAMAGAESTFHSDIGASTSKAQGLFQFIPGTWKHMLKDYGKQYGVALDAERNDPVASSIMAAAMLKFEGYPAAVKAVGTDASITDLYLTHFLGASGGAKFLRAYMKTPDVDATTGTGANAVAANEQVFYVTDPVTKIKTARSYRQIYNLFAGRLTGFANRTAEVEARQTVTAKAPADKPVQVASAEQSPSLPAQGQAANSPDFVRIGKKNTIVQVNRRA